MKTQKQREREETTRFYIVIGMLSILITSTMAFIFLSRSSSGITSTDPTQCKDKFITKNILFPAAAKMIYDSPNCFAIKQYNLTNYSVACCHDKGVDYSFFKNITKNVTGIE